MVDQSRLLSPPRRVVTPTEVLEICAKFFRVPLAHMAGSSVGGRARHVVLARMFYSYVAHEMTAFGYSELARILRGGHDRSSSHTTVMEGHKRLRKMIAEGKTIPTPDGDMPAKQVLRGIVAACEYLTTKDRIKLPQCEFCRYEFDEESLGRYGCPNCHGEGLQ